MSVPLTRLQAVHSLSPAHSSKSLDGNGPSPPYGLHLIQDSSSLDFALDISLAISWEDAGLFPTSMKNVVFHFHTYLTIMRTHVIYNELLKFIKQKRVPCSTGGQCELGHIL